MRTITGVGRWMRGALVGGVAMLATAASAQTPPLAWDQVGYFKYNIENIVVTPVGTGIWKVKVIFSVYDDVNKRYWNIKTAEPFKPSNGGSMTLDIAWNPSSDFTNTGSTGTALAPLTALGSGAALPVQVRSLNLTPTLSNPAGSNPCLSSADCPNVAGVGPTAPYYYWIEKVVTPLPTTATHGRVALEGRPVCAGTEIGLCPTPIETKTTTAGVTSTKTTYANIPVTSATADFVLTASPPAKVDDQRRKVVDIEKCKVCHANKQVGGVFVPRLSLHGANRNENLNLCVACHNPNQTDVPYRWADPVDPRVGAAETPIDFKVMVHSIHAGGFRTTPYVVVGFQSSVNDFSGVRFPKELRKSCPLCHVADANGRWSFELPLNSAVLGTTIKTQSVYKVAKTDPTRSIDVDPANDTKISPTAATCSACHTKSEVRMHMVSTGGASFATTQAQLDSKKVVERCVNCHGRGKDKDVRKVHELFGFSD